MADHKFDVGQSVRIFSRISVSDRSGHFTIVRVLPTERGIHQYRIKSEVDGHERVVTEEEVR
jgi:hypothetical protein